MMGGGDDPILGLNLSDWQGIMIEPNPLPFSRLLNRYKEWKNISLLQCAISAKNGRMDLYYIPEDTEGVESWTRQISTLDPSKGRIGEFENKMMHCSVEVRTLADIQQEFSINSIDYLQIDTEGHDFEVMKGWSWNWGKPKIIHFEDRHLHKTEFNECIKFLIYKGYSIIMEPHPKDVTAYLADKL
jgi:FkbM family methyltransferase